MARKSNKKKTKCWETSLKVFFNCFSNGGNNSFGIEFEQGNELESIGTDSNDSTDSTDKYTTLSAKKLELECSFSSK